MLSVLPSSSSASDGGPTAQQHLVALGRGHAAAWGARGKVGAEQELSTPCKHPYTKQERLDTAYVFIAC